MTFDGDNSTGKPLSLLIRLIVAVFCICCALVFLAACSKEEQKEVQKPKVVVPIEKPAQKSSLAALTEEDASSEPEKTSTGVTETASLEEKQPTSPSLIEIPKRRYPIVQTMSITVTQKNGLR